MIATTTGTFRTLLVGLAGLLCGAVIGLPIALGARAGMDAWTEHRQAQRWAKECIHGGGRMVTIPLPGGRESAPSCWESAGTGPAPDVSPDRTPEQSEQSASRDGGTGTTRENH